MPPESRDSAYLWDMLDAARTLSRLSTDVTHDQYLENGLLRLGVERLF